MDSLVFKQIADKLIDEFDSVIVRECDLVKSIHEIPFWFRGYCIIAKNEYYFGDDIDLLERYKCYTQNEFDNFAKLVYDKFNKLVITCDELNSIDSNIPIWAKHHRFIGDGLISFESNFKPYCPLFFKDNTSNIMEFDTLSGNDTSANNEPIEKEFSFDELFENEIQSKPEVIETPMETNNADLVVEGIETIKPSEMAVEIPQMAMQSGLSRDDMDYFIEKFSSRFSEAFNHKDPVLKVPPRPEGFYTPDVDKLFIKWGIYSDIEKIISHNMFYPCFITGLSGNGKTMGIDQACANLGSELLVVNITQETDEDDLLGGYRLVDGNTVWQDGPVVVAMRRGCPLLLDEIDYGSSKLSCLQSVLSGKSVLIKKTGEVIKPKSGFTVFATANTKGQGDVTGKFAGTNIMNEAFLDRFPITLHNPYPPKATEIKIFRSALEHFRFVYDGGKSITKDDEQFINRLVHWCSIIRATYEQEAITEVISTRRGVDILKSYVVFGSRERAIQIGTERFDEETRTTLAKLYSAVDDQIEVERKAAEKKDDPRAKMRNGRAAVANADGTKTNSDDGLGTEWGSVSGALNSAMKRI